MFLRLDIEFGLKAESIRPLKNDADKYGEPLVSELKGPNNTQIVLGPYAFYTPSILNIYSYIRASKNSLVSYGNNQPWHAMIYK